MPLPPGHLPTYAVGAGDIGEEHFCDRNGYSPQLIQRLVGLLYLALKQFRLQSEALETLEIPQENKY